MKLRTSAAATALALAAALTLTACADDSGDGATPSASASSSAAPETPAPTKEDVAALESVKVEGEAGKEPKLSFKAPLEVSTATSRVIDEGDGAELAEGMKVTIDFVGYLGADGKSQGSTWAQKAPQSFVLGDASYGVLTEPLQGQKVGSRVLVAFPSQDAQGQAVTAVNLIEVTDAKKIPTRAEGEAVEPEKGLPTVTLDDSGKPSVEIPKGYEAPKDLVSQPLIKGDGAKVKEGQTITAQYTGWTLDGKSFDSSWERGTPASFPIAQGQVIDGWVKGLAGQTVGSQVLLVIPAEQAYGAEKSDDNELAGQPLVFVVDILDAQ
ncbi:FKBP-type peptidyl-prolyl cis-trans isomerase [Krasilnikoviella flava]|uniref:peptidylprolyl isomerase n=1 Tax=Krasilnikoviella flava TaxID=526729 RepID=A0A1T5I7I9_9MICO|nr:FKBP-type peptidyl-prolyl cis-trans isomerase [Krasilnikoviella flava]SKC35109.1 peptidylprolyl isomerase [Krasilnikoviella flava]